ncbi:hypothetical protein Htur_1932 [Haloterrigena turkmenica DSM 5511]|uniref:Uncharacterized protein n=1 Tax=Haloterrigena turkmenica (strain ATCC 51198 / DSM 5511 / JCM 9101 / NCIMB 13204 / VKM B-1734 / 4k) TaxID=543526 RepID=D2RSP1_HALTV|nr:hypothetical protein [Haloterrigena turkmenica]ADB60817.1 hypothetical protein Htur_1932 [Haloterrigena turkmenica DSM 5511]
MTTERERPRDGASAALERYLPASLRRAVASPATFVAFAALVVPFALGWLETRFFSPLALPGYLLYSVGTAIGNALAPRFEFWIYWVPFLGANYAIAVTVGYGYERWRNRATNAND